MKKGELVSVQKAEEATWDTDKWIMKQGLVYELSKEELRVQQNLKNK